MICQIGANFIIQHHRNNFFESHCERPGFCQGVFFFASKSKVFGFKSLTDLVKNTKGFGLKTLKDLV